MRRNQEENGNRSYVTRQISHILNHLGFEYDSREIMFYAVENNLFRFPRSKIGLLTTDNNGKVDGGLILRSLKPRIFTSSLDKLFESMGLPIDVDDFNLSAEDLGYQV